MILPLFSCISQWTFFLFSIFSSFIHLPLFYVSIFLHSILITLNEFYLLEYICFSFFFFANTEGTLYFSTLQGLLLCDNFLCLLFPPSNIQELFWHRYKISFAQWISCHACAQSVIYLQFRFLFSSGDSFCSICVYSITCG